MLNFLSASDFTENASKSRLNISSLYFWLTTALTVKFALNTLTETFSSLSNNAVIFTASVFGSALTETVPNAYTADAEKTSAPTRIAAM